MSIESKLKSFLSSREGKVKVAEEKKKALTAGRSFGQAGGTIASTQSAMRAAITMRSILLNHLATVGLSTITENDIHIGTPTVEKDGLLSINIWFDADALYRPSLRPEKYDGVDNIVMHLTHGWDARGSVYGYWESAGKMTYSRQSFPGDDFMQQAAEEFNALRIGDAELNEKYMT